MTASDPAARTLSLLGLLSARSGWTGPELAARLGVSPRTIRRDVARLTELGYTVLTRPGPGGEYRLGAGQRLPPLLLDDDEALAVVLGLRMAQTQLSPAEPAERALARLEQVLPSRLRAGTTDAIQAVTDGPALLDPAAIGVLATATAEEGRVAFSYTDRHGNPTDRAVDPTHQVFSGGQWYLIGFDVDRDDWRLFRLDRVRRVRRLSGRYPRRDLPGGTVTDYLRSDFGRLRRRPFSRMPISEKADRRTIPG